MSERFSVQAESYNEFLQEAIDYFAMENKDGEAIVVSAHEDRGDCDIHIHYTTVVNKQAISKSVFVPVFFITRYLSKEFRLQLYGHILSGWRNG